MALVLGQPALAHAKFTRFRVVADVTRNNNDEVLAVRGECLVAAHGDGGANFTVLEGVPVRGKVTPRQRTS